jgi:hypothetical protein
MNLLQLDELSHTPYQHVSRSNDANPGLAKNQASFAAEEPAVAQGPRPISRRLLIGFYLPIFHLNFCSGIVQRGSLESSAVYGLLNET